MDGTFPSTRFQNNIGAAQGACALATGTWMIFAVQMGFWLQISRVSRVEQP